jgi:hypothetical protein
MRRSIGATLIAIALAIGSAPARAQPFAGGGMPNLAEIVGRALPDAGMPTGTVSVRVSRRTPATAVAGVEVAAIIKTAGGDLRRRSEKTDAGGRVLFEGMVPGDEFHAEVKVDGETLRTETFTLPAEGGLRTMLIAELGKPGGAAPPADAATNPEAAAPGFTLGASVGVAQGDARLPTGTLEVTVHDENGAPIANQPVLLGMIDKTNKIDVRRAPSDANGVARFTGLPTGENTGYAAVLEWKGARLGTAPFAMPVSGGASGEIRALTRTADPAVMTIGAGGRVVVQMHEDTLQFLEMLPLENTSDKMFDPGPGAVEIPLPQGFVGAEAQEGDRKVDVRQNHGIAVHGPFAPKQAIAGTTNRNAGHEVAFGFVLPYHGSTRDFVQPMPNGIGPFTLIAEEVPGISIHGPGIGGRQERELGGKKYWVMPVEAVPPGGALSFTIGGLPATESTGRNVAGVLALALVAGAVLFARRPSGGAGPVVAPDAREKLVERRESLFSDLVALEAAARASGKAAPADRRQQIVTRLEGVYRELAALDQPRAA